MKIMVNQTTQKNREQVKSPTNNLEKVILGISVTAMNLRPYIYAFVINIKSPNDN